MSSIDVPLRGGRFGSTTRRDRWWAQPVLTLLGLSLFIVYATWAALQGHYFRFGPYLSPFYSPDVLGDPLQSWFGGWPHWWPAWAPMSAALLILWAPGGFRVSCYYYRGAYYKAFWADPPSCTVGEPRKKYRGERSFPLILQNIHRYFLYLALVFLVILAIDVWRALWFLTPDGKGVEFGIGVGTIVLAVNVVLLGCYTFGCHSLRHLIGGRVDEISKTPLRSKTYACVSCLNRRHMLLAWGSLFSVMLADLYVRLCAMGILTDWRIV
jgi:hypothetical protein